MKINEEKKKHTCLNVCHTFRVFSPFSDITTRQSMLQSAADLEKLQINTGILCMKAQILCNVKLLITHFLYVCVYFQL